jgi:hypothetical protein
MKIFKNKLLLIGAVCAAPLVLGTLAYVFGWGVGKPANYGELIAPRTLSGPPFDQLRGKWLLVSFDGAACDARCERKLYYLRQVRRAQGGEMERVERLWVVTDSAVLRKDLFPAIEGTYVAADHRIVPQFPGVVVEHIYLVDPLGNLVLRFPPDPDPSRMIKDLERLLKYSRIG